MTDPKTMTLADVVTLLRRAAADRNTLPCPVTDILAAASLAERVAAEVQTFGDDELREMLTRVRNGETPNAALRSILFRTALASPRVQTMHEDTA